MYNNQIKIQNFGPIKAGYQSNNGYMPINQLSVFCGTQGTGKSTLVKLYSTFVWLEKALMRGDMPTSYPSQYSRFVKKYLAYHGIDSYISDDTYIHFKGQCYDFEYKDGHFTVNDHRDELTYERPQVMYYPAERNLLSSVVEKGSSLKGLPESLSAMQIDYRQACQSLTEDLKLPINDVKFHYDSLNQMGTIISPSYKVRINNASSGLQSASPLFITLNHLYECTTLGKKSDASKTSTKEQEIIDKRIHDILLDDTLDSDTRSRLIKKLSDNVNKRMVNIIEEPEQNLFPDSQEHILYEMIRLSAKQNNQLLFTTHSPYIINYLMLAIKAYQVNEQVTEDSDREQLNAIVPKESMIDGNLVSVYQLDLDGNIAELPKIDNLPSDDNYLNHILMEANSKFSSLVEIQMQYE